MFEASMYIEIEAFDLDEEGKIVMFGNVVDKQQESTTPVHMHSPSFDQLFQRRSLELGLSLEALITKVNQEIQEKHEQQMRDRGIPFVSFITENVDQNLMDLLTGTGVPGKE
jgi:hypothetical protein